MGDVRFTVVNIGTLSMNKFWGETDRVHTVSATCTLMESGGTRVIVDPSPYLEDLERLLFDRTGLRPAAVDAVYLTHYHGDHRFGVELFEGKPWLIAGVALDEWGEQNPEEEAVRSRFEPAEGRLPDSVTLLPTPGHTLSHTSLRCETPWGIAVIAGDACMTREFLDAEEGFHNSLDFDKAAASIREIKRVADYVVPGHDNVLMVR